MTRTNVLLPKWGMGIDEGAVVRWLKAPGDAVNKGDPIAEVETAKAVQDLEAPVGGTIVELLVRPGDIVAVGTSLAVIAEA